jgi:bile acid:Na+ symporter, BASS family
MFNIGSSLCAVDFKKIFRNSKVLNFGLMMQLIFLPLIALLIATTSSLNPLWKAGLFVVAICPGGTMSNFISYISKTDVALSISLTSINSLLIILTIPIMTNFGLIYFGLSASGFSLDIHHTIWHVLFILIIPVIFGIWFNEKFSNLSKAMQKPFKFVNIILLIIVFGVQVFADEASGGSGLTSTSIKALLPYCLLLHFTSMILSYIVSLKLGFNNFQSTTIGIEVGLQNTTLALLITATLLKSNEMSQPAIVFAMFSSFTTLIFAFIAKKYGKIDKLIYK